MKFTLAVLSVVILSVATQQVEEEGKEFKQLPIAPNYHPVVFRYPQQQLPYYNDPRWLWSSLRRTSTVTTTTTSTSTTTCTVSTSVACSGRRRRWVEWPEDEETIAPSAVEKIETTPEADMTSVRQSREADPQYLVAAAPYPPAFQQFGYALQPTFDGQYQYTNPEVPYYYFGGYPYGAQQIPDFARWGWSTTTTTTVTTTSTTTVRSTPTCSTTGTLSQC